jgi:anaphase-promoting complex subunit 10
MQTYTQLHRPALAELDPNADLQLRTPVKRPPISLDQENEEAVHNGILDGIYTWDEVTAVTNSSPLSPTALPQADQPRRDPISSEDEVDDERLAELRADVTPSDEFDDLNDEIIEEDLEVEGEGEQDEEEGDEEGGAGDYELDDGQELHAEEQAPLVLFDPTAMGLKEINNLAHFGVSSHKPGNGVDELLSEDVERYWQSVTPLKPPDILAFSLFTSTLTSLLDLTVSNHTP